MVHEPTNICSLPDGMPAESDEAGGPSKPLPGSWLPAASLGCALSSAGQKDAGTEQATCTKKSLPDIDFVKLVETAVKVSEHPTPKWQLVQRGQGCTHAVVARPRPRKQRTTALR